MASTSGISATLDLDRLVSRHCAIVGSTGAGKSNLVSVILEALGSAQFPSARVLVIDPHGEYANVAPGKIDRLPGDARRERAVAGGSLLGASL